MGPLSAELEPSKTMENPNRSAHVLIRCCIKKGSNTVTTVTSMLLLGLRATDTPMRICGVVMVYACVLCACSVYACVRVCGSVSCAC